MLDIYGFDYAWRKALLLSSTVSAVIIVIRLKILRDRKIITVTLSGLLATCRTGSEGPRRFTGGIAFTLGPGAAMTLALTGLHTC